MILLRDIIGHDEIIKTLQGALASGRVAHAYLFSGPRGVGKHTTAVAFARALVCLRPAGGDACGECDGCGKVDLGIHPDVRIIRPGGATVKISQIRELAAGLQFGPATGRWTVRILDEADAMTPEAANSLLKTLEDPLPGVVFILVTARPQAVLPTILSRCQHIYFHPLGKSGLVQGMIRITGAPEDKVQLAAALAGGSLGKALDLLSGGLSARDRACRLIAGLTAADVEDALSLAGEAAAGKEEVLPLLDMMVLWFRDILLYNETGDTGSFVNADRQIDITGLAGCYTTGRLLDIIEDIERAKNSLTASANVQLALEALFLRLAGFGPESGRLEGVI
ncbi:MAG: DNA polymerase III subunit delta' [Peptococcaceae bacterium]|nr:DNA polymerase III subunit delta' [Peptococcaceae bacterium]